MCAMCPYICNYKTEFGYCKFTSCINPLYMRKTVILNRTLNDTELKRYVNNLNDK